MKSLIAFLFVFASFTSFAQGGKPVFEKGRKLEVITQTKKTSSLELMGQAMETSANITVNEVFDIEDANSNGVTIEHKLKRLNFDATAMGQSQTFDSEKEEDMKGETGKIFEKSLKSKYTLMLDAWGKVTGVKLDDDNPNQQDPTAMAVSQQLGISLSAPATGSKTVFTILPAREVKTGETWTDTASINGDKRKADFSVNSITDTEINLDFKETVAVDKTIEIMGTAAALKSTNLTVGRIVVDKKTGLLKSKLATMTSEGTIGVQGMEIPNKEKSEIVVVVK